MIQKINIPIWAVNTSCNTGNFPSMNHQRIQAFLVKNVSCRAEPFCWRISSTFLVAYINTGTWIQTEFTSGTGNISLKDYYCYFKVHLVTFQEGLIACQFSCPCGLIYLIDSRYWTMLLSHQAAWLSKAQGFLFSDNEANLITSTVLVHRYQFYSASQSWPPVHLQTVSIIKAHLCKFQLKCTFLTFKIQYLLDWFPLLEYNECPGVFATVLCLNIASVHSHEWTNKRPIKDQSITNTTQ